MHCVSGKLLKLDMTNHTTDVVHIPEEDIINFIGGRALGAKVLYDMNPTGVDPLSPENNLFVLTGPLTGTIVPNSCKYVVITKSPLTGAYLDSYSSGYLAPELKFSGWDGLMVTGRSEKPVYVYIRDDKVEFRDAAHIWGKGTIDTEEAIIKETDEQAGLMVIGPAGERMALVSSINSDHYRQAARGGGAAVMGSKNLKGIAVLGSGHMEPYDRVRIREKYMDSLAKLAVNKTGQARKKYGTPLTMNITNEAGMLPTRNFQRSQEPEAIDQIDGEGCEKMTIKTRGCWGCMIACSKITKAADGPYKDTIVEGPEYETVGLLGSNLGLNNLPAVIACNALCDDIGIDTIAAGVVTSFVMECFEKGLLTEEEIGVKDPIFGNSEAALEIMRKMALREGFGEYMSRGVKRLAEHVGKGSEVFAMHVKGMEFPAYDPRAGYAACLGYAVCPRGACHRRCWPPALEVLGGAPRFTTENKAKMVQNLYNENMILHTILVCDFPSKFCDAKMYDYAEFLTAVTGHTFVEQDFYDMAERGETLIRCFNNREGLTRADDNLPRRITEEPTPDGPGKGKQFTLEDLDFMLDEYYAHRGWDKNGVPLPETLEKYGLIV